MIVKTNLVRTSRDGDQFHYLWAARRCLHLLSTHNDLVAISIEGPSLHEEESTSAGEELIDIAEYFGSENIQKARLVRYVQLKHSTVQTQKQWTASGLKKTITGFAKRYKELLERFPDVNLSEKIQFCFVTNRLISQPFLESIKDAAEEKKSRHPKELEKLKRFVGLEEDDFSSFCKIFHFEDGQPDYWNQRNILFHDTSYYLLGDDTDAPLRLKDLVTRKALSEGEHNPVITKMDVLRALNTDLDKIFPAKCLIEEPIQVILRKQESTLIEAIINSVNPVIVHAEAGVGKTVFSNHIGKGLPDGSVCILYDCFGNGNYRNPSGYRHRHKDGLVQIANELSSMKLCHLLIPTTLADSSDYVKAFMHRLKQAISSIRSVNSNAILCIVCDAADNAQMAAEEAGEKRSFVRDLIREKIPEGVRLVFLCRTHRQEMLDPPIETTRLELETFGINETAEYLRRKFPDASKHDINEFHRLSSSNPRVQALSLSYSRSLADILRSLGPNPTNAETIIGKLLEDAINKLKDNNVTELGKKQIDMICIGLAVLRPLIPINVLSNISRVSESAIRSFAIDLGRPLLVTDNAVQFVDEPAETWFREKFKPSTEQTSNFIAILKPLAATSAYVASTLPQLMLEAGQFLGLVDLVLKSEALPEASLLEKHDIELQRLQFSLKAALRSKRYLEATKLAIKAGGEEAGENRQRKILENNIDLAGGFLETNSIQEIVSRRMFGSEWKGSHHVYEASILSTHHSLVGEARSRLRISYEWLNNWSNLSSDERKEEEISDQDIVELIFANINIHGAKVGAKELCRWSPNELIFRVGKTVTKRLIDHGRLGDVEEFVCAAGNNLCLVLATILELQEIQKTPPIEVVKRAFKLISNKRIKLTDTDYIDERRSPLGAIIALINASIKCSVCTVHEAASVLERYLPSEPPRGLSSPYSSSNFSILRGYSLVAALRGNKLEMRDLAYGDLKKEIDNKNQHSLSNDLRDFQQNIGALLPWHQLWANTLLGVITKQSLDSDIKHALQISNNFRKTYYRDDFHTSNDISKLWLEILFKMDATDAETLNAFLQWKSNLDRPLFIPTLVSLARLCGQKNDTKQMAIDFALESFNLAKNERTDAEEKSERYIDAARAILNISKYEAKEYFNEAINVATKIGDENLSRWTAIIDLADRAAKVDKFCPETAYRFARCAELTYEYVVRDKYFDWHSTIEALCGLCPSSTLAILSRWRDRKFGWSERILPIAIERLVENSNIDAHDAMPLICYKAQWNYPELVSRILSACHSSKKKEETINYFFRYIKFGTKNLLDIKSVASQHGITIKGLDEIIAYDEVYEDANRNPIANDHFKEDIKSIKNWDGVFFECDLTKIKGIDKAYSAFKSTESPWYQEHFFEEAIRRIPVGSEIYFIKALSDVQQIDLYSFRGFLEKIPYSWKERPAITKALTEILKIFCRRYCMEITKSRHYEALPLKMACSLVGIKEDEVVSVVLDAIGEISNFASSERLFSLVSLLAIKLSQDEALEALNFSMNFFDSILEHDDGDGSWGNQLLPPSDVKEAIAGYVWASMASPSSILRWEGSHVVLSAAALGRQDILAYIMNFAINQKSEPFVDKKFQFYDLHAMQWFIIALARASTEFPNSIKPFSNQIIDWALNGPPHILIRLFAARTALALINSGNLIVAEDIKEQLSTVGISPFPTIKSKRYNRNKIKEHDEEKNDDKYCFSLDIGPYWYAPLGSIFGLSQKDIEKEALKVIRNDFKSINKGRWDEDERARTNLYEEYHTSHSHGSYPRADNLHFYYSYHAMMVVADKLVSSMPVHCDTESYLEDELADFINRHDISRKDGRWLWDRRDFHPLVCQTWKHRSKIESDQSKFEQEDFNDALYCGDNLSVWGYWTEANDKCQRTFDITSALVSPDKSVALLSALNDIKDPYAYAIPSIGDCMEIDKNGFSLKEWVVVNNNDRGLDARDHWSGGINFPPPMPEDSIIKLMALVTDLDFRNWKDERKLVVMTSNMWGNYDEGIRHERADPERGYCLNASQNFIVEMLTKLKLDMIIKVVINQRSIYKPYESYEKDDKKLIPAAVKLYLIGKDGKLRTIK